MVQRSTNLAFRSDHISVSFGFRAAMELGIRIFKSRRCDLGAFREPLTALPRRRQTKTKKPPVPRGAAAFCNRCREEGISVLGRPGSDLLSRVLRRTTVGAGEFYGRVRDGIGYRLPASTTRSAKDGMKQAGVSRHLRRSRQWALTNENDQAERAISTGKLNALPRLHTRPINVMVYHGS